MQDDEYEAGYEAGLRCDPSDEWMFGYGAALEIDIIILDTIKKPS